MNALLSILRIYLGVIGVYLLIAWSDIFAVRPVPRTLAVFAYMTAITTLVFLAPLMVYFHQKKKLRKNTEPSGAPKAR
jgi:hypothetical protein